MQIYMKPGTEFKLRAYKKKTGTPMSQILEEVLNDFFEKADKEPTYTEPESTA